MIVKFISYIPFFFHECTPSRSLNEKLGRFSESLSRIYLLCRGYRTLKTRYKNPFGEIDLVMMKGKTIMFCEVKYRPCSVRAAESISKHQQSRIINGAKHFLLYCPHYAHFNLRFDAVLCHPKGIRHEKHAWQVETSF